MHINGKLPTILPGPFSGGSRYNSYGAFLKEKFGARVYKVSVDAGFTCPNRDGSVGWGGCVYCNNDSFRPASAIRSDSIQEQILKGINYLKGRYRAQKFVVYFQPFTNTHAPLDVLKPLYETSLTHPDVVGLSVGTRPDCVDEAKLQCFEDLARQCFVTIEYGLESIYDATLARINRGHDFRCWQDAISKTRGRGIWIGTHLILGFPWESRDEMVRMADTISNAGLHFLKLHHLHIVKNTRLALEYERQPFPLLDYNEYLDLAVAFLERLNPEIRIERLFGLTSAGALVGPIWGKTKAEMQRDIEQRLQTRNTCQGHLFRPPDNGVVALRKP